MVGKKPRAQDAVPTEGSGGIAPRDAKAKTILAVIKIKNVFAKIGGGVEPVFGTGLPVDFGIEIIKKVTGTFGRGILGD